MDRNTLLQNKLTHSHKTSRKFGAKKYGRGGEGGWSRHDQPQALPTLSSSQSFRITLARREESVSTFKAPASPPLPPLRKGGKGIVAPLRRGKALLPHDVTPSRATKTRDSKPSLQYGEHRLFITPASSTSREGSEVMTWVSFDDDDRRATVYRPWFRS